MADFFTSTFVAPVDKVVAQKVQKTEVSNASGVTETTQSTKTSGSNFSMCEIIM